jgi:hypothetical protein
MQDTWVSYDLALGTRRSGGVTKGAPPPHSMTRDRRDESWRVGWKPPSSGARSDVTVLWVPGDPTLLSARSTLRVLHGYQLTHQHVAHGYPLTPSTWCGSVSHPSPPHVPVLLEPSPAPPAAALAPPFMARSGASRARLTRRLPRIGKSYSPPTTYA